MYTTQAPSRPVHRQFPGGPPPAGLAVTAGVLLPKTRPAAAAWLCSDHASFITGATIPIDGGKLADSAAL